MRRGEGIVRAVGDGEVMRRWMVLMMIMMFMTTPHTRSLRRACVGWCRTAGTHSSSPCTTRRGQSPGDWGPSYRGRPARCVCVCACACVETCVAVYAWTHQHARVVRLCIPRHVDVCVSVVQGNELNMDFLAWMVDPAKGQAGFSPHRDR
jgi:hypothetical protein